MLKNLKNWALGIGLAGTLFYSCEKEIVNPEQPKPNITQALKVVNDVELEYSARLQNTKKATLKIFKDDNAEPIITEEISGKSYNKIFNYSNDGITKGFYKFKLESDNLDREDTLSIPNYAPESDFNSIDSDKLKFNEGDSTTVYLPELKDKNPEDEPKYIRVNSLDEKVKASLNNNELKIKNNENSKGTYGLEIVLTDGTKDVTKSFDGTIYDLLDIYGTLEDNETHTARPGIVKIYDSKKNKIGEMPVDNTGKFGKRLEQRVSDLTEDILVQGRWIENSTSADSSYIRTMKLPTQDKKDVLVRVVPYTGLSANGISVENFKRHMAEVLSKNDNNGTNPLTLNPTIQKWSFAGDGINADYKLNEIIISKTPKDDRQGYFTQETAEHIKDRILDPNDIGAWFNGKITKYNIPVNIEKSYTWPDKGRYGRFVIYPDEEPFADGKLLGGYSSTADHTMDGYLDIGEVVVKVTEGVPSDLTVAHEIGHVSGLPGHAETLSTELTIMPWAGAKTEKPTFADKKTAKAIYEDSYVHGTGTQSGGFQNGGQVYRVGLKDILGLRFLGE